ncbi:MAG: hypothetical protein ACFFDN_03445 [Candidatus Hodarchaeota archaeon]
MSMLDFIIIILMITFFLFGFTTFSYFLVRFLKYRAKNTGLIALLHFSAGFGIVWQMYRVYVLILLGGILTGLDESLFIINTSFIFIGLYLLVEITIQFIQKSGDVSRVNNIIRIIYIMAIPLLSVINIFTYLKTAPNSFGIYVYQVHPIMIPIFFILYLPVALFLYHKLRTIGHEFKNRETYKILLVFTFLLIFMMTERLLSISYTYQYGNEISAILFNFSMRISYIVGLFILVFKYPTFLEFVGVFFDVKSLYLISKKGETIYGYDFESMEPELPSTLSDLILGGFVYAISGGLKHIIKFTGDIETIKMRNVTILFIHGKEIFAILFSTEYTPILRKKLNDFVNKVETKYETILKNWKGDLTIFRKPKNNLEELVWEIFR